MCARRYLPPSFSLFLSLSFSPSLSLSFSQTHTQFCVESGCVRLWSSCQELAFNFIYLYTTRVCVCVCSAKRNLNWWERGHCESWTCQHTSATHGFLHVLRSCLSLSLSLSLYVCVYLSWHISPLSFLPNILVLHFTFTHFPSLLLSFYPLPSSPFLTLVGETRNWVTVLVGHHSSFTTWLDSDAYRGVRKREERGEKNLRKSEIKK